VNATIVGKAAQFNICFRAISLTAHAGIVLLCDFAERLGIAELLDPHALVNLRERGCPEAVNCFSRCAFALACATMSSSPPQSEQAFSSEDLQRSAKLNGDER
jgi:hypothetical protein